MGAAEESPKRVASEAKGPAGPPEGAVFEELFGRAKSSPPEAKCPEGKKARAAGPKRTTPGGQKSPGRRPKENNARRAKKRGPQAQREQCPEGEGSRAAGPRKNNTRRAKKPGPHGPEENNARRAKRNISKKGPGRRPIKTLLYLNAFNSVLNSHKLGCHKTCFAPCVDFYPLSVGVRLGFLTPISCATMKASRSPSNTLSTLPVSMPVLKSFMRR